MRARARLNRNILECKFAFCGKSVGAVEVLIETYWNVNISPDTRRRRRSGVLIETYWNVNLCKSEAVFRIPSS